MQVKQNSKQIILSQVDIYLIFTFKLIKKNPNTFVIMPMSIRVVTFPKYIFVFFLTKL